MRPMEVETTETVLRTERPPVLNLRWSGIFAGLVVGISTNLLLLLLGAAIGLAVLDAREGVGNTTIPTAAAVWNTVSMILAAFAGAYVAARSAGLRRRSDGVLHGVVAWGAAMLISALVAGSATGAAINNFFGGAPQGAPTAAEAMSGINQGNREQAVMILQEQLGLTPEQANRLVDQALVLSGREESASPAGRADAEQTLRIASLASGWLAAAIVLSLLAAVGGGISGARGSRRIERSDLHQHTTVRRTTVETPAPRRGVPPADAAPV